MNVILITVIMPNGPMLIAIVPSDIMLRNAMQNVIMLNVIRLSDVAPFQRSFKGKH